MLHSVAQQEVYSGYYKTHWLKYLCIVLPNCLLLAHGVWRGKEHYNTMKKHDNTMLNDSKVPSSSPLLPNLH